VWLLHLSQYTAQGIVVDGKPWSSSAPQDPDCVIPGGNFSNCRRKLVAEMFGTDGDLPSRSRCGEKISVFVHLSSFVL
jgi:hypothetical protein